MKQMLFNCAMVGIGGFAGSLARYLTGMALQRYSLVFPSGTLAANCAGCFTIGCIMTLASLVPSISPGTRLLLATGFCGGFTTMSSFIYELMQLFRDSEYFNGGLYLTVTLAGSVVCFFLGVLLIKLVLRTAGGIWN